MKRVYRAVDALLRQEKGATSVEYAVILMLILLAMITAVQLIGGAAGGSWTHSSNEIDQAFNS